MFETKAAEFETKAERFERIVVINNIKVLFKAIFTFL